MKTYFAVKFSFSAQNIPTKRKHTGNTASSRPGPSEGGDPPGDPDHGDDNPDDDGGEYGNNEDNSERCSSCFIQPCVTESQRHLGGQGQEPSECNPSI